MIKRKLILSAIFVALSVVIGYAFMAVPNVELLTATVFIAGFVLGPLYGALTGATAEFIYSFFNPLGVPMLPLLLAQVSSLMFIGFSAGLVAKTHCLFLPPPLRILCFALIGLGLTLIFDVLTTLSYVVFLTGLDPVKMWANFISGMGFYLIHIVVNTAIFAAIVPFILRRVTDFGRKI